MYSQHEERLIEHYRCSDEIGGLNSFAYDVNHMLRNKVRFNEGDSQLLAQLDRIITQHSLPAQEIVHRAAFSDCTDRFIKNGIYRYPAYMSTTKHAGLLGRHWSGDGTGLLPVLLHIKLPQGAGVIDLSNTSLDNGEQEVLIGRNAKFVVTSKDVIDKQDQLDAIMTKFYARGYSQLIEYQLDFIGYY